MSLYDICEHFGIPEEISQKILIMGVAHPVSTMAITGYYIRQTRIWRQQVEGELKEAQTEATDDLKILKEMEQTYQVMVQKNEKENSELYKECVMSKECFLLFQNHRDNCHDCGKMFSSKDRYIYGRCAEEFSHVGCIHFYKMYHNDGRLINYSEDLYIQTRRYESSKFKCDLLHSRLEGKEAEFLRYDSDEYAWSDSDDDNSRDDG